jgi:hypothetical protein
MVLILNALRFGGINDGNHNERVRPIVKIFS